jgi:hypothetical protein
MTTTTHPLRPLRVVLVALALAITALAGLARPAEASTATTVGVAAATSYGFKCDSTFHWLHQNWPNISVRSAQNQEVYVQATLNRWNGFGWDQVMVSPTYVGVSNVDGSQVLGFTPGGLSYKFALAGQPSLVQANDGYGFTNLTPGIYTTVERYTAAGLTWTAVNAIQGTQLTSCSV